MIIATREEPFCIPCILIAVPPTGVETSFARAKTALERGLGVEATRLLAPLLRSGSRNREDELDIRAHLCQAWLLQGDFPQATSALGRAPDALKEPLDDGLLSNLWRLHGHLALAKGDSSRAIALQSRALRHGELAHDSHAIGLAHLELAHCYRTVGDSRIVHDHLTKAAAALHAAGDRRHLALVHSLSGVLLAQAGRSREAVAALRQGERLAQAIHADDVVARLLHNQANVALVQHEREQALALAERSVVLYDTLGPGHGLSVALATLGQILVQLGDLERAESVLTRSLEIRGQVKFHETTVAVFDTLTQIHLMRGSYQRAEEYLRLAREAYAESANPTVLWYEWSLRVLGVRLSVKRGDLENAVAMADALARSEGVPRNDRIHAELIATEALVAMGRVPAARLRLDACQHELDPRGAPSTWGEFLRARGLVHERSDDVAAAHHDFAQSASVFDLLGERYPAALSQLALARLATAAGNRSHASRYLAAAAGVFRRLGAERDLEEVAKLDAEL
jgi:tetratricopeptide (TPR) repeat protein